MSKTILTERESFMVYVTAIGERAGHTATAAEARVACPDEYAAWRQAFISEYGYDPVSGQAA